jgi:hypothetical protein
MLSKIQNDCVPRFRRDYRGQPDGRNKNSVRPDCSLHAERGWWRSVLASHLGLFPRCGSVLLFPGWLRCKREDHIHATVRFGALFVGRCRINAGSQRDGCSSGPSSSIQTGWSRPFARRGRREGVQCRVAVKEVDSISTQHWWRYCDSETLLLLTMKNFHAEIAGRPYRLANERSSRGSGRAAETECGSAQR